MGQTFGGVVRFKIVHRLPDLAYKWPVDDNACWVDTSMPEGCEERVHALAAR